MMTGSTAGAFLRQSYRFALDLPEMRRISVRSLMVLIVVLGTLTFVTEMWWLGLVAFVMSVFLMSDMLDSLKDEDDAQGPASLSTSRLS
jgi:hypothetical protein